MPPSFKELVESRTGRHLLSATYSHRRRRSLLSDDRLTILPDFGLDFENWGIKGVAALCG
jgi:hypothetical protein